LRSANVIGTKFGGGESEGGQKFLLDTGKLAALKFPQFWFEPTLQGKFMLNIAFGQSKYLKSQGISNLRLASRAVRGEPVFPFSAALRAPTEMVGKFAERRRRSRTAQNRKRTRRKTSARIIF